VAAPGRQLAAAAGYPPHQQQWPPAAVEPARRNLRGLSITALVLAGIFVLAALIGLPSLALLGAVVTMPLALVAVCLDQRGRGIAIAALALAVMQVVLYVLLH
jgi:hypothetical protein